MADISQIKLPNNLVLDIKDATARDELTAITNAEIDALFEEYDLSALSSAEGESF